MPQFSKKSANCPNNLKYDRNKILLDYILSQVGSGECPYVKVNICGRDIYGLLDSGANCTFMGDVGWKILQSLGVKLDSSKSITCTVANSESCQCKGTIMVPVKLRDVVKIIKIYIVPSLRHELILGTDFWREMGIVPDLRRGEWYFSTTSPPNPVLNKLVAVEDLTNAENLLINKIVDEHFTKHEPNKIGCTSLVKHTIITESEPIKQRYYPVSPYKQKQIDEELDKMIDAGVVEPSESGWSSPVLLVPKKDGSQRFCVDFRKLNKVTKRDAYPLPYISSILSKLGGAKFLSSLDLKSGYWQVELEEGSKQYTAFTVPGRGLFQFTRLPFGIANAPSTFQRLVDTVLGPVLEPYVLVYLDDIIVATPTYEKHVEVLREVFRRLESAGLTLNRDKCLFCRSELRYLGYVINREGLHVDPEKVNAMVNLATPKTVTDVRRIIGTVSWYRRFVSNFSDLIAPLTKLLRKGKKFDWSMECENAFSQIKEALVSAPILACPDFSKPFELQTDASAVGIGAVLLQVYGDREHVICYLSRALNRAERNYSATERELLAVVWSVEKLRCYLEGVKFTIITDHFSLLWLDALKDPSGRLGRWALRLQQFDYEVRHRKGKDNVVPDVLSRAIPEVELEAQLNVVHVNAVKDKWYLKMLHLVETHPLKYLKWRIVDGNLYKYVSGDFARLESENDKWKLVIPKEKRQEVLYECHDSPLGGHLGMYKTVSKVTRRYYWPCVKADVARYVKSCEVCQQVKPEQKLPAGLMGKAVIPDAPWRIISMDLVGPLPKTKKGNMNILVVTDNFSKFSLLFPLKRATASNVVKLLEEHVLLVFGVPQYLRVDNGVQFKSREFTSLATKYRIRINYNPYYHPQANPTERVNRVVKTMLAAYVKNNHRDWDTYLGALGCAIRTARHEVTSQTPYRINFGKEMHLSGKEFQKDFSSDDEMPSLEGKAAEIQKLRESVFLRLQKAQERAARSYNLRRRLVEYGVGDKVLKRKYTLSDAANYYNAKLAGRFEGPYKVKKKRGYCTYELVDEEERDKGIWHVKDLKPYTEREEEDIEI